VGKGRTGPGGEAPEKKRKRKRMKRELKIFFSLLGIFLAAYLLPLNHPEVQKAILEAFRLLQWYARNHTLACVVPALFIAGGIITFLSQESVLRYLGPKANKLTAYSVASVSGAVLAVCSCSVLPMFVGIYKLGAGLGPASAFLYSGPAINILAIFLTARVLGFSIGLARAVGAVAFAFLVGLLMAFLFRKEEAEKAEAAIQAPPPPPARRPLWKTLLFFACMILFLVFSDWYNPGNVVVRTEKGEVFRAVVLQEMVGQYRFQLEQDWMGKKKGEQVTLAKDEIRKMEEPRTWVLAVYHSRWYLAGLMGILVVLMAWRWLGREEIAEWMGNTWDFAKLLVPLLFGGVFAVGFLASLLPPHVVASLVGDNSLQANLVASVVGVFWYFATLTEIPICEALGRMGMHQGPMLTLLLAGPALSLPSILVIGKVLGAKKTFAFCVIIALVSALAGMTYGALV